MNNIEKSKKVHLEIKETLDDHKKWIDNVKENINNDDENNNNQLNYKNNINKHNNKGKRWEKLYELEKIKKDTREYVQNNFKEEMEEDLECTFHPKILNSNLRTNIPFLERNNIWVNKRMENLNNKKSIKEDKELEKFSYQPNLVI